MQDATSPGGTDAQIFFGDNCSSLSEPQRTTRRMLLPRPVIETLCAALGSTTGVSRNVLVTPSLFTSVTSQPSFVRLKIVSTRPETSRGTSSCLTCDITLARGRSVVGWPGL